MTNYHSDYHQRPEPLYVSQSLIKVLIKNPDWYQDDNNYIKKHCPRQVWHYFYEKPQVYKEDKYVYECGQFGESLLLGFTAEGKHIPGLPKHKKTGEDRKDEQRIRAMAQLAKIKFMYHQIMVHEGINTQVPLAAHIERDVFIKTRLDLFPTQIILNPKEDDKPVLACIDIKFPKSLNGYGAWDWSNMEKMNHAQPDSIFYQFDNLDIDLLKKMYPDYERVIGFDKIFTKHVLALLPQLKFFYFVVAYNKIDESNIIIKEWPNTELRQKQYIEMQRRAIDLIENYFANGFEAVPYLIPQEGRGCHKCPISKKNNPELGYCEEY